MTNNAPWSFDEARDKCRQAAQAQEHAENELREAGKAYALARGAYDVVLAKRIVILRADGEPATLCEKLASGTEDVARLRQAMLIAEGVYKAMEHAAWRHNQNRKDAQRFSDWSARREFAESGPGSEQPDWTPIGSTS